MGAVTIQQALQDVADNPHADMSEPINMKVHELVCRTLFDIANHPDAKVRGSMARANRARKIIMDRLVGRRRAGSHPATRSHEKLEFLDLTVAHTPELGR